MLFEIKQINDRNALTIPETVREELDVKKGDKVVFTKLSEGLIGIRKFDPGAAEQFLMVDHPPVYEVDKKKRI
jgi:AbrB family looped-hinge helix DNA binding protein